MQLDLNFFFYIFIQVISLKGIFSIDNAVVLGAMVSVLPKKERVPWPGPLKFLVHPVLRLLGGQQPAALKGITVWTQAQNDWVTVIISQKGRRLIPYSLNL